MYDFVLLGRTRGRVLREVYVVRIFGK